MLEGEEVVATGMAPFREFVPGDDDRLAGGDEAGWREVVLEVEVELLPGVGTWVETMGVSVARSADRADAIY